MAEPIIDILSEQAIKLASLVWKKDTAEARDILLLAIETREINQHTTIPKFQEFVQLKARPKFFTHCPVCGAETPPTFTHCPACNVNLEIVRNNAIKDLALEFAKYGFIMGQQSAQTVKPSNKKITLSAVVGWVVFCFFALIAYGWVKDMYLMPLLYSAPTPYPTLPPIPTSKPKSTTAPTPTENPCLLWSQVTAQMEGRTVCVYGTVIEYREDWDNFIANIYFGTRQDFYIVSNYRWDVSPVGECLTATGEIQLNTYKIPYIKIQDSFNFCQ